MPHLTVAANQTAFTKLFDAIRDDFSFEKSDSASLGPLTASYHIKFHLANGSVDLRGDNTVQISELDIKWDILDLTLAFDIPEQCFGGFCLIPIPFDGCALEFPEICLFTDNPDLTVTLPLGGITSEVSITGSLSPKYHVNPDRPAGMNDWDAQDAVPPLYNTWQIFLVPEFVDVDPIDVADTVGDLLQAAVDTLVDDLLGDLPDIIKDIIKTALGGAIDILRLILDIPDDIQEFIENLLNVSLGLVNIIAQVIIDYLAADNPLTEIEDPYPILDATANPNDAPPGPASLVPVKIPIRDLTVSNNDVEMVIQANVG
jgi:hypothetical protein